MSFSPEPRPLTEILSELSVDVFGGYEYMRAQDPSIEGAHIHNCYEIYINLAGDVAFMEENRLYHVEPGDIILSRPNEMHHCVYLGDSWHGHYCIWLFAPPESSAMCRLLAHLPEKGNRICLPEAEKRTLCALAVCMGQGWNRRDRAVEALSALLRILLLLEKNGKESEGAEEALPENFRRVLDYLNACYKTGETIAEVAEHFFVSRSTLDRWFARYLHLSPRLYLESKRFACAKSLLEKGESVQTACLQSGFSDYSHFISRFRARFSVTPLQYQRERRGKQSE